MRLRKGHLEYLLSLIPEESILHSETKAFIKHELSQYDDPLPEDKFLRFMRINQYHEVGPYVFLYENDSVTVTVEEKSVTIRDIHSEDELDQLMWEWNLPQLRFCSYCGAPMVSGFTDESLYFCCEEEFFKYMDSEYGKCRWRPVEDDSSEDCYEYLENDVWEPTNWYYTEWE